MRKTYFGPALAICCAVLFSNLCAGATGLQDTLLAKRQELLRDVGRVVTNGHYSPQALDDEFSSALWSRYLAELDPQGQLFDQGDLSKLKIFQLTLDDEIKGLKPIAFLPAVLKIYQQRLSEAKSAYQILLSKPVVLKGTERVFPSGRTEKRYASNATELRRFRANRATYLVFQKLLALKSDSSITGNHAALEPQARKRVAIRQERTFERLIQQSGMDNQFSSYVNMILRQMDPHSSYLPPKEQQRFMNVMSNRFGGIGARLGDHDEGVRILALEPSGTSAKSGLVDVGDVLLKLGEGAQPELKELEGFTTAEISDMVRGEKGTQVTLVLRKATGIIKTVKLYRAELQQENAFVKTAIVLKGRKKIGYITFPLFYQGTDPLMGPFCSIDVANAIMQLNDQQVSGIVFDLRNNGGGSLQEVVRMVSLLIPPGPVVQVRDRDGLPVSKTAHDLTQQMSAYTPPGQIYTGPISVLVNEYSASASEIFAAAVQDCGRGIILGSSSTYGKGTVQRLTRLSKESDGVLQLTVQQFYRLNGASTQINGVVPDVVLPDVFEYDEIRERHLSGALAWDLVAPASYSKLMQSPTVSETVKSAVDRVATDTAFVRIAKNGLSRRDHANQTIKLDIDEYQKMTELAKEIANQNQQAIVLGKGKQLQLLPLTKTNDANWLEVLKKDIYLEQAVRVLADAEMESR